jgi:hypothetical protein
MNTLPDPRSTFERWLALVVRYWAANMTLVHSRGSNWPGFGYSDAEKEELQSIAGKFAWAEYFVWVAVVAVVAIAIFAAMVIAGLSCLTHVIGGDRNMAHTPAALFYLALALIAVVSLTIGLPAAMLPSAALVGRWFGVADPDLPDRATTARYFHKLWFQITRMSIIMIAAVLPLWLFVPYDSKFMAMARLVAPLLSPVILVLTTAYYFSARLQRNDRNTRRSAG